MDTVRDDLDDEVDTLIAKVLEVRATTPVDKVASVEYIVFDDAWCLGCQHMRLFDYARPTVLVDTSLKYRRNPDGDLVGCITQIKRCVAYAWTPELTAGIRADARLVGEVRELVGKPIEEIRVALNAHAEWQRKFRALQPVTKPEGEPSAESS